MTLPYPGSSPNWGQVASTDGVVTSLLMPQYAAIRLVVDFTVAGSPIHTTAATTVYAVTVTEQNTGYVVRGLSSASAPGGAAVGWDGEAPFGVALSYVAQAFDASGNLLATSATAVTNVQPPASGVATWIKSLTTPSLSVIVETSQIPAWDADIAQGVIRPIGATYPIVVSDVRQAEVATLTVLTREPSDRDALLALLATPGPYLLQQPGFDTADRFVTVGKVSRKRSTNLASETFREWTLPLTAVARPDPGGWSVAIPGHTYADSAVSMPLYSNRTGTYLQRATS